MLASNREMRRLLQRLGAVSVVDETVGVEVRLPVAGISPALRRLIRIAAASGVVIPIGQLPSRAGGWMASVSPRPPS